MTIIDDVTYRGEKVTDSGQVVRLQELFWEGFSGRDACEVASQQTGDRFDRVKYELRRGNIRAHSTMEFLNGSVELVETSVMEGHRLCFKSKAHFSRDIFNRLEVTHYEEGSWENSLLDYSEAA